jgi:hypothetical protein
VVSVEAAAGRHAVVEAGPGRGPLLWHTNHGRYLSGADPEADLAEGNPRAQSYFETADRGRDN